MKKLLLFVVSAIMFSACCGEKKSDLVGTSWSLIELNGQVLDRATLENSKSYTLSFEKDSSGVKISGLGDGNRFFGEPVIDTKNSTLTFGNIGGTRMMSPNQDREDLYMKALGETTSYVLTTKGLVLKNGSTILAKFESNCASNCK